jgi:hypothetical protein
MGYVTSNHFRLGLAAQRQQQKLKEQVVEGYTREEATAGWVSTWSEQYMSRYDAGEVI